jgi:Domain of unknown function (DUF4873)
VDDDGYSGPATLVLDGAELDVNVVLRGHFEPIDGRYHWYGRLRADPRLDELLGTHSRPAVLRTPGGEAAGTLSDPDPWHRYRIAGISRPPFPLPDAPGAEPDAAGPDAAGSVTGGMIGE